jgi:hypothetical protein
VSTLFIAKDVVVVEVEVVAERAFEGRDVVLVVMVGGFVAGGDGQRGVGVGAAEVLVDEHFELAGAGIPVVPDVAQFGDGPEEGALEFVDVVREGIGGCHELGLLAVVHLQLDLADYLVVELDVYQDVVGASPQSVLYPQDLELLGLVAANFVEVAVDGQNLCFF